MVRSTLESVISGCSEHFALLIRSPLIENRQILLGGGLLVIIVLVTVLGTSFSGHDALSQDPPNRLAGPSQEHPLGTDTYGRDTFVRMLVGGRISLLIGLSSIAAGGVLGALLGVVGGYWGGVADLVIMRVVDALLSFPTVLIALVIVASFGAKTNLVILAIAIAVAPRFARIIRGSVLSVKSLDFVTATRALGASDVHIIVYHVLPHVLSPLVVTATFMLATALLVEAALGFLGLGVQPPTPTWGNIINEGVRVMRTSPALAIYPGLAITFTVLAFNLVGDGLRDLLDPRLQGREERM